LISPVIIIFLAAVVTVIAYCIVTSISPPSPAFAARRAESGMGL
jgi:phage shock protein PspC (stress-responsive transcriptional regulator)